MPWRNGVWKHKVCDGPRNRSPYHKFWSSDASCGDTVDMTAFSNTEYGPPLVGERGDSFVVTVRLHTKHRDTQSAPNISSMTHRTGYNQLWTALSLVHETRPCEHGTDLKRDKIMLDPEWTSVFGLSDNILEPMSRLKMYRTAGNPAARWHALIYVLEHDKISPQLAILRSPNCCLRCATDQTTRQQGEWYLIL